MKNCRVILSLLTILFWFPSSHGETKVVVKANPFEGRVPRAVTDAEGTVHLTYNNHGNVYYSRMKPGAAEFSEPIRVNSIEQSAAIADMAVGPKGRVHLLYHGNIHYVRGQIKEANRKLQGADIKYTFYSRLNEAGDGFEEQREVSGGVWGFDGGCAIAADRQGNVYAFFNGTTTSGRELDRHIYMIRSADEGRTFSEPRPIDLNKGVCACCHLAATVNERGEVMLVYRVAENGVNRDSYVLVSKDQGTSFTPEPLDKWELRACPGSLYSFAHHGASTYVSWRTKDEIFFALSGRQKAVSPAQSASKRRAAILGSNAKGEVLIAWSEGENFNKPHDLRWQLYDRNGQPSGSMGRKENAFQRWGNPALFADAHGDFVIIH